MATLQNILDNEALEATAVGQLAGAVSALQAGDAALQAQLAAALANATIPPDVQAQIDAAFAASKANSDAVNGVLAALAPPVVPTA